MLCVPCSSQMEKYLAGMFGDAEPLGEEGEALDEREMAQIEGAVENLASQFKAQLASHIKEQVRASKLGQSKVVGTGGAPELQLAVANNQYEKVTRLLADGADPNAQHPMSLMTPLHHAADAGYKDIVDALIQFNATIDVRGQDALTPLHLAAAKGRASVTELLLREGADPAAVSASKQATPLYLACEMGHTRVVSRLLGANASVSAAAADGSTALHVAAREGHEGAIEMLLEHGARVDEHDHHGARPIHYASARERHAAVELLLQANAAPLSEDSAEDAEKMARLTAPSVQVEVSTKTFSVKSAVSG